MSAPDAILNGRNLDSVVRSDSPVNRVAARLDITRHIQVLRSPHPLVDSPPDVLFASAAALPAGRYTLRRQVCAAAGGDAANGEVAFSIGP